MSEEEIKQEIEQVGYKEFYRYYIEAHKLAKQYSKKLQQKETIIEGLDNTIENLEEVIEQEENIIKEVREYIESYMPNYDFDKTNLIKLLEILDKERDSE